MDPKHRAIIIEFCDLVLKADPIFLTLSSAEKVFLSKNVDEFKNMNNIDICDVEIDVKKRCSFVFKEMMSNGCSPQESYSRKRVDSQITAMIKYCKKEKVKFPEIFEGISEIICLTFEEWQNISVYLNSQFNVFANNRLDTVTKNVLLQVKTKTDLLKQDVETTKNSLETAKKETERKTVETCVTYLEFFQQLYLHLTVL